MVMDETDRVYAPVPRYVLYQLCTRLPSSSDYTVIAKNGFCKDNFDQHYLIKLHVMLFLGTCAR